MGVEEQPITNLKLHRCIYITSIQYMQFSFITYGIALCINDSIHQQNTNDVKIYEYASERNERA